MKGLFERDYTFLTEAEKKEKENIDNESARTVGLFRKNFFHKYPKAVRHNLKLFPNNYMDTNILKETEELSKQCDEFDELLKDKSIIESSIKSFIQGKGYYHIPTSIFDKYNFGHHEAYLFKEFKLGTSFIADYVLVGKSSEGYQFVFVEFENPYGRITVNTGDYGEVITKGIRQVDDWKIFIESNFSTITEEFKKYANKQLPDEFYSLDTSRIYYCVVAGRRTDYNDKTYRLRRNDDTQRRIKLLHYDNLLDSARKKIGCNTY